MATPLNTFKSVAANVTTTSTTIYTCPAETTAIVLLAQATNISANDANITFSSSINGGTELAKDFTIPVGDAAALLSGKLVIPAGANVFVSANANSRLKVTLSILETT